MKTKLLTLALFGFLTLGFVSCAEEDVTPTPDVTAAAKPLPDNDGAGRTIRD